MKALSILIDPQNLLFEPAAHHPPPPYRPSQKAHMNTISRQFALSACALATTVLLTACGGGEATAPPDTQAPTVVITVVASAQADRANCLEIVFMWAS